MPVKDTWSPIIQAYVLGMRLRQEREELAQRQLERQQLAEYRQQQLEQRQKEFEQELKLRQEDFKLNQARQKALMDKEAAETKLRDLRAKLDVGQAITKGALPFPTRQTDYATRPELATHEPTDFYDPESGLSVPTTMFQRPEDYAKTAAMLDLASQAGNIAQTEAAARVRAEIEERRNAEWYNRQEITSQNALEKLMLNNELTTRRMLTGIAARGQGGTSPENDLYIQSQAKEVAVGNIPWENLTQKERSVIGPTLFQIEWPGGSKGARFLTKQDMARIDGIEQLKSLVDDVDLLRKNVNDNNFTDALTVYNQIKGKLPKMRAVLPGLGVLNVRDIDMIERLLPNAGQIFAKKLRIPILGNQLDNLVGHTKMSLFQARKLALQDMSEGQKNALIKRWKMQVSLYGPDQNYIKRSNPELARELELP